MNPTFEASATALTSQLDVTLAICAALSLVTVSWVAGSLRAGLRAWLVAVVLLIVVGAFPLAAFLLGTALLLAWCVISAARSSRRPRPGPP